MKKKINKEKKIKVQKQNKSGLASFIERPVPSYKEVSSFEKVIREKARTREIKNNLSEIYKDKKGNIIDVKKLDIKRRTPWILRMFKNIFILAFIFFIAYFAYLYFFTNNSSSDSLELKIIAPENIVAGEEFSYSIEYNNPSRFVLKNTHLEVQYPDNFIFIGSSANPSLGNYAWDLPDIPAQTSGLITITGKLISPFDSVNLITAKFTYIPSNFSSMFSKEVSSSTIIKSLGFDVSLEAGKTAFTGQNNNLSLSFSNIEDNYLDDFHIIISSSDGVEVKLKDKDVGEDKLSITKHRGLDWEISGVNKEISLYKIPFIFTIDQDNTEVEINIKLEKKLDDGQSYIFWSQTVKPELVKSDLNLSIFFNNSQENQSVNFGDVLHYQLKYNNQGENSFDNVVIMAVLGEDFLDWPSYSSQEGGSVHAGSIIWTKDDVAGLKKIEPGEKGVINFSIKLRDWEDKYLGKEAVINSYAQYSFNGEEVKKDENKSNEIKVKINSNLSLQEEVRYFNNDNVPVGSGSLPPQVGEKTSFRVYWTIINNLHELNNTQVVFNLPQYVSWNDNVQTNVGNLIYNSEKHQVVWAVGRIPISVNNIKASFDISITPSISDVGKILILSPGSEVSALDTETNDIINSKTKPTTTKLEDDDIASLNNSGIIKE